MSPMATDATSTRRPRRRFTDEFKAGAVRLVLDEGKTVGRVARDLDLTESALRTWVDQARADRTNGRTGLTTEEREELRRLRQENRVLQTEREILKGSSHKCVHDSAPAGRPRRGKRVRMRSCQLTSGEVVCRSVDGRLRGPRF